MIKNLLITFVLLGATGSAFAANYCESLNHSYNATISSTKYNVPIPAGKQNIQFLVTGYNKDNHTFNLKINSVQSDNFKKYVKTEIPSPNFIGSCVNNSIEINMFPAGPDDTKTWHGTVTAAHTFSIRSKFAGFTISTYNK